MADLYKSKSWLKRKYQSERKSLEEIAKEAGTSHMTIKRWLKKYGLYRGR